MPTRILITDFVWPSTAPEREVLVPPGWATALRWWKRPMGQRGDTGRRWRLIATRS